jgi:hypothetical protein
MLDFDVNYSSGCRDRDYDEEEHMEIKFGINLSTGEMELKGEEFVDRSPDEY